MCMPNVNITAQLFKNIYIENNIERFIAPFNRIIPEQEGDRYVLKDFHIFLKFNFVGTKNKDKQLNNILYNQKKLYVLLRMTKVSLNVDSRLNLDLHKFTVDLNDDGSVVEDNDTAYAIYEKDLQVPILKLPQGNPFGKYVIKVLLKSDENEEGWTVQTIIPLNVDNRLSYKS